MLKQFSEKRVLNDVGLYNFYSQNLLKNLCLFGLKKLYIYYTVNRPEFGQKKPRRCGVFFIVFYITALNRVKYVS